MRTYITTLTFLLFSITIAAQTLNWANQTGGIGWEYIHDIATDANNNIYIVGSFYETVDFDSSSGTNILTSNGARDAYIQKVDEDGNFIWAVSFGGESIEEIIEININSEGDLIVSGYYSSTTDFDPGTGKVFLEESGSFISSFNQDGTFNWVKGFGGSLSKITSSTIDFEGNIISTGTFFTTSDFDPGPDIYELEHIGFIDVFIHKMDANGNFIWAKSFGSTDADKSFDILTDTNNDIYTTGYFRDTVDFDPGVEILNLSSIGEDDGFIQKLDQNGNFIWAKRFGGDTSDTGKNMALTNTGDIILGGNFRGVLDIIPETGGNMIFSKGFTDIFFTNIEPDGTISWVKTIGGTDYDRIETITITASNKLLLTGTFSGLIDVNPSNVGTHRASNGGSDIFVLALDQEGGYLNVVTFGGVESDFGAATLFKSSNELILGGTFQETMQVDPQNPNTVFTSIGEGDTFLLTLNGAELSSNDFLMNPTITMHPNPTLGSVTLSLENANTAEIQIFDILGRHIITYTTNNQSNYTFNVPGGSGMYVCNVIIDGVSQTYKLIKH